MLSASERRVRAAVGVNLPTDEGDSWSAHRGTLNPTFARRHLNGIVENHTELRRRLQGEGQVFTSETDAEVVAHLIASHYDGDLPAAVRGAFAELRGHYAFIAISSDEQQTIVGARKECPLVVGVGERAAVAGGRLDLDLLLLAQQRQVGGVESAAHGSPCGARCGSISTSSTCS